MVDAALALKDAPFVSVEVADGIAVVAIDRPERRNALHPDAHKSLARVFDTLPEDPSIRAVILTGRGDKAFCSGYDLKDNHETGIMFIPETGFGGLTFRTDYPLPLIAAVNGVAFGGGFEMALACDFIIAADTASFALPEPKVGWAALGGGAQRLPHAVGIKRAMDIILTGRTVSAGEALNIGLVSEVVAPDDLLSAARRWAQQIVENAPLAISCSRQVAYRTLEAPLREVLNAESLESVQRMLSSEDSKEGKRAFVERRKPNWTGR